jgi:hypothetical protein
MPLPVTRVEMSVEELVRATRFVLRTLDDTSVDAQRFVFQIVCALVTKRGADQTWEDQT